MKQITKRKLINITIASLILIGLWLTDIQLQDKVFFSTIPAMIILFWLSASETANDIYENAIKESKK
jgi:uncharacterized membrane protein YiaA